MACCTTTPQLSSAQRSSVTKQIALAAAKKEIQRERLVLPADYEASRRGNFYGGPRDTYTSIVGDIFRRAASASPVALCSHDRFEKPVNWALSATLFPARTWNQKGGPENRSH